MANPFANAGLEQWNAPGAFEGVGQGLMAMGVDASGLGGYLDKIGLSKNDKGGYQFKPPTGSIPPTTTTSVAPVGNSVVQSITAPVINQSQIHPEIEDSWSKAPVTPAPPEWDQQKGQQGIGDMFKGALMKMAGNMMMG